MDNGPLPTSQTESFTETQTEPLTEPPIAGSEADTLLGALERNRRTFAWNCGGLDSAGLNKQHPPSTVTPGGLLKHLALVEDSRPACASSSST